MEEKILEITKESYNQEVRRSNSLLTKSDYLVKYITSTFVFINAILVLIMNNKLINPWINVFIYMVSGILLCRSLYLAVRVQILSKGVHFPTGMTLLNDIAKKYNDEKKTTTTQDMDMQIIFYYSRYIEELEVANNMKASILNKAYTWYLRTIIGITIMLFVLLILIA